ncbi:membrane protein [Rhizobium leguminosarum bv. trifolii CB782]|uniref:DUF2938 domain-containing protein n=1 Tax=Rhizobium hidalgonense TaxID=1538159 RepID=UPI00027D3A6D|nr:DUF2938 domain-containing protein [Rhizobium hidalgonense]AHG45320.1 membrane protein [Rhizobium leguminosarum bv. trifolii CB782]EJC72728.1 Protein of unknown function (DUF2938) [Rhizobium leguminosarum bv. trifolii WSM2012]MDR9805379.1 DUF2938 domain-containing protein [Rhizobium hidalgonense]
MFDILWRGLAIGAGATILMDLWAILLTKVFGQTPPNWAPVGRWFWHLRRGKVFHDSIADAEPYEHELALGWISHYAVGILYGVIFALIMGQGWLAAPTFLPAWTFGIITVGAGWFLLQPGLGIGWAASKHPNPNKVRCFNLLAHTVFALGLYGTALILR